MRKYRTLILNNNFEFCFQKLFKQIKLMRQKNVFTRTTDIHNKRLNGSKS